ncbi:MAG: sulfurtransferase, partial [Pseudomonadota bacterium]
RLAGTLAGALNISHDTWFLGENPVITPQEADLSAIRQTVQQANGAPLVSFCNTGHWAATNWFVASEVAGIEGVKLFPESMVGWTLANMPVLGG